MTVPELGEVKNGMIAQEPTISYLSIFVIAQIHKIDLEALFSEF